MKDSEAHSLKGQYHGNNEVNTEKKVWTITTNTGFIFKKPHPLNKHIIRIILQNYHDKKLFPSKKNNSFHLPSLENSIYNELSGISSVLFNMASSITIIRSTENVIAIVFTNAHI